jgi:hypothetical protein
MMGFEELGTISECSNVQDSTKGHNMKKNKIATADEAIGIIRDDDVMAAAGFVGNATPEELHRNLLSGCYPAYHQRKDALEIGR